MVRKLFSVFAILAATTTALEYGDIELQKNCTRSSTSLTVAWKPVLAADVIIVNYIVTANGNGTSNSKVVSTSARTTTLSNLKPNVAYQVYVTATTTKGIFMESNAIQCSTTAQRQKVGLDAYAIGVDKIRVIWRIEEDAKEKPSAYGVSFQQQRGPKIFKLILRKTSLNYTIVALKPNTEYLIEVAIYTNIGGHKIETKKVKTKRIVLMPTSPIRNLSIASITWNRVTLRWTPPENYTDPAKIYQVKCRNKSETFEIKVKQEKATFANLQENSLYAVEVAVGAEDKGFYEKVIEAHFRTKVRFPPPTHINVTSSSWNTATLSWQPIETQENFVYQIVYYQERFSAEKKFVETKKNTAIITDLEQETGYFFLVKVGNGIIYGDRTSETVFIETTDRDECFDSSHSCTKFQKCMNTKGSYECHCRHGYIQDGTRCIEMKKNQPKCSDDFARELNWPVTQNGQYAFMQCPKGTTGISRRYCEKVNTTHARWNRPDLSQCVSAWVSQFSRQVQRNTHNSSFLMKSLSNEFKKQKQVVGGDIQNVISIMGDIVGFSHSDETKSSMRTMAQNMISLTDDLLSPNSAETWNDLPKNKMAKSAGGILKNVEQMAYAYSSSTENRSFYISTNHAVMEVRSVLDSSALGFNVDENSIQLPETSLTFNSKASNSVYFGSFNSIENFLGADLANDSSKDEQITKDGKQTRTSAVIAATVFAQNVNVEFSQPVVITHKLQKTNHSQTLQCVFWDFSSSNSVGAWSTKGCQLHYSNETHVICHCYHLTNFAVLMSVTKAPLEMKENHIKVLSVMTTICICISLVALMASFATFCSVRAIQSDRNTTHKHLVLALFLAQLLFVSGIDKTFNMVACRVIGMALHYFFLVVFSLMGMEGFVLYMMLIKVYKRNGRYGNRKLLVACWALPVVLISITAGIDFTAYGNEKYCWINVKNGYIWSFVGPVIFVIAANSVIMIQAVQIMRRKSKKRDALSEEIWYWIKCCSMLVSILGLSWIIGIFYVNQNSIVMAYIFNILNALQGLALFVFLCLLDQRVRDSYRCAFSCIGKDHFHLDASRSVTGTKSTLPSRHSKEVSLPQNSEEIKSMRKSAISMEDQEAILEFAEDDAQVDGI